MNTRRHRPGRGPQSPLSRISITSRLLGACPSGLRRRLIGSVALVALIFAGCASGQIVRHGGRITLIRDPPSQPFVLRRATLQRALDRGPSWFIQQARVRPVTLRGAFYGFQIVSLFADDPGFHGQGLRRGDIVQRVDGMPIERPEQFMRVWRSLANSDHLSFRIIRSGTPLLVTWLIRASAAQRRGALSAR